MSLPEPVQLRCFRGAFADDYGTVSIDGFSSTTTAVAVTVYNMDGSTFISALDSATSGAVSLVTLGGTYIWTFDPAHADALGTSRVTALSKQFNTDFLIEFVETAGPGSGGPAAEHETVLVTVNGPVWYEYDYPNGTIYASINGVTNSAYATPEYGNASRLNPARELREAHAMISTIGAGILRVRGRLFDARANSFSNMLIKGDPDGAIRPRANNTITFTDCVFEDIDLQGGASNGWFSGAFKVVRGRLSSGFVHLNNTVGFRDGVVLEGSLRFISTTSIEGNIQASNAVLDLGNSLTTLNLFVTQGTIEVDNMRSGITCSMSSTGAVVKLESDPATNTGTVSLAGFWRVTDAADVDWDGVSTIGGVTISARLIASQAVVESEAAAVIAQGDAAWVTADVSSLATSAAVSSMAADVTTLLSRLGVNDMAILKGALLGNYVLDGGSGSAAVVYDANGHAAAQRIRVFASSAATTAATLGAADGADSEIALVAITSTPVSGEAYPGSVVGLLT